MKNTSKDRFPTIPDDATLSKMDSTPLLPDLPDPPSPDDINACVERIRATKDLSLEMEKKEVDIQTIASIIARAKYEDKRWEIANRAWRETKANERDFSKKVRRRGNRPLNRKKIKTYTRASARKIFMREITLRIKKSKTKQRPYLPSLLVLLEAIFSEKTNEPYKYIAALFNLFNLWPEKLWHEKNCNSCRYSNNQPLNCSSRIFLCPNHENTKHSIWKMTREAKKTYPNLRARLADPENQI